MLSLLTCVAVLGMAGCKVGAPATPAITTQPALSDADIRDRDIEFYRERVDRDRLSDWNGALAPAPGARAAGRQAGAAAEGSAEHQ